MSVRNRVAAGEIDRDDVTGSRGIDEEGHELGPEVGRASVGDARARRTDRVELGADSGDRAAVAGRPGCHELVRRHPFHRLRVPGQSVVAADGQRDRPWRHEGIASTRGTGDDRRPVVGRAHRAGYGRGRYCGCDQYWKCEREHVQSLPRVGQSISPAHGEQAAPVAPVDPGPKVPRAGVTCRPKNRFFGTLHNRVPTFLSSLVNTSYSGPRWHSRPESARGTNYSTPRRLDQ